MPISKEVRRLQAKWLTGGTGWPKRLDWLEIDGLRGWRGERFSLPFPLMALVGENGAGKSTVLQAAASVYGVDHPEQKVRHASDFFPDTAWDRVRSVEIRAGIRQGSTSLPTTTVRKPTDRWRGNPERPKRYVDYIDLSRIQPVSARVGYKAITGGGVSETSAEAFEQARLERFSAIMGRRYDLAKMALTDADPNRAVPVIRQHGAAYSGFHQGAGETTIAELLQADLPKYGLILIDEIESSLHPRAQRRLVRDLADRCRQSELQIVMTTHSPYILDELPLEARAYIMQGPTGKREIMYGVSPDFAMSKMDEVPQFECELYVEDERAGRMLMEIMATHRPDLVPRCVTVPYGAASVGQALGQMIAGKRFRRPSVVFLDGDKDASPGCLLLPGDDTPERVVFESMLKAQWKGADTRLGRPYSDVADACSRAMTQADHHRWIRDAATALTVDSDTLWQALCAQWANSCVSAIEVAEILDTISDTIQGIDNEARLSPPPPSEEEPPSELFPQ